MKSFARLIFKSFLRIPFFLIAKRLAPKTTKYNLIRLGSQNDGGYLVPDCLMHINYLFSPGVSFVADFEEDCAKLGIKGFMCDASVDASLANKIGFSFLPYYLSDKTCHEQKVITLEDWVNRSISADSLDLMLQMDIEGHEYDVLMATSPKLLQRFRIIVIELHGLSSLIRPDSRTLSVYRALNKIFRYFEVIHFHPNNCCGVYQAGNCVIPEVAELTLLRKDYAQDNDGYAILPNSLDQPCIPSKKDIQLPTKLFWTK